MGYAHRHGVRFGDGLSFAPNLAQSRPSLEPTNPQTHLMPRTPTRTHPKPVEAWKSLKPKGPNSFLVTKKGANTFGNIHIRILETHVDN